MLRITALSLLLGALPLIAGLTLFFAPMSEPDGQTPSILWNADSVRIERGVASRKDGELLLELDGTRLGTVHLNFGTINASAYPFLHLALEETPEDLNVGIFWTNSDNEQHRYSYILPSEPQDSLWLATSELKGWTGDISDLSLYFFGTE